MGQIEYGLLRRGSQIVVSAYKLLKLAVLGTERFLTLALSGCTGRIGLKSRHRFTHFLRRARLFREAGPLWTRASGGRWEFTPSLMVSHLTTPHHPNSSKPSGLPMGYFVHARFVVATIAQNEVRLGLRVCGSPGYGNKQTMITGGSISIQQFRFAPLFCLRTALASRPHFQLHQGPAQCFPSKRSRW